jgi:hypothetical protein
LKETTFPMAKQQKSKTARGVHRKVRSKATLGRTNPLGHPKQRERHKQIGRSSRKAQSETGEKRATASVSPERQSAAEEPNHFSAAKSNGQPEQRKRRRKQVRLSVAMRKIGLDEYMVAESLAGLIEKLGTNKGEAKVLLDVLKESTRFLEPPPKAPGTNEVDERPLVTLRHDVPRPARNIPQDQNAIEPDAG